MTGVVLHISHEKTKTAICFYDFSGTLCSHWSKLLKPCHNYLVSLFKCWVVFFFKQLGSIVFGKCYSHKRRYAFFMGPFVFFKDTLIFRTPLLCMWDWRNIQLTTYNSQCDSGAVYSAWFSGWFWSFHAVSWQEQYRMSPLTTGLVVTHRLQWFTPWLTCCRISVITSISYVFKQTTLCPPCFLSSQNAFLFASVIVILGGDDESVVWEWVIPEIGNIMERLRNLLSYTSLLTVQLRFALNAIIQLWPESKYFLIRGGNFCTCV